MGNELKSIRANFDCESTINIEEPGRTFIANKNYCGEGMKFNIIASGHAYEIGDWVQGYTYNDIDTIMNQKVRIDLNHVGHDIVEYPDEQSYNTCSNGEILVEENNNLSFYDIDLIEIGTRYIGCSVDAHDCNELQKFKIVTSLEKKLQLILNRQQFLLRLHLLFLLFTR